MHRTIFTTPVLNRFFYFVSVFYLRLAGWKVEGGLPQDASHVIIAAPHTSNWDLLYALTMSFAMHFKVHWMGKDALFRPPFGSIMQWLGGLPIDRSKANSMVAQSIEVIKTHECLNLVVPPEGTRKKVHYWKTGFYYIAQGANVPIVLSYLDYKRKTGGIGPIIMPTGDIEADMEIIRTFYASVTGKHANAAGEACISVKN